MGVREAVHSSEHTKRQQAFGRACCLVKFVFLNPFLSVKLFLHHFYNCVAVVIADRLGSGLL